MILPDVNILVHAFREDAPDHRDYREWLESLVSGPAAYGMATLVLSGFLRVVTHSRVFAKPTPLAAALGFVEAVTAPEHCVLITPSARHWPLFIDLARKSDARGNRVPDAYLAALAMESGCEWVTSDRDFARFPGLLWRHPLH